MTRGRRHQPDAVDRAVGGGRRGDRRRAIRDPPRPRSRRGPRDRDRVRPRRRHDPRHLALRSRPPSPTPQPRRGRDRGGVRCVLRVGHPLAPVADERTGIAVARGLRGDRTQKALSAGLPVAAAIMLGIITGIGGRAICATCSPADTRRRPSSGITVRLGRRAGRRGLRVPGRVLRQCRSSPPGSRWSMLVVMLPIRARSGAAGRRPRRRTSRRGSCGRESAEPSEPREPGDGQEPDACAMIRAA